MKKITTISIIFYCLFVIFPEFTSVLFSGYPSKVKYPEGAVSVMDQFRQALKECEWEKALLCCVKRIHKEAKKYKSTEAFFKDVVPIKRIIKISH